MKIGHPSVPTTNTTVFKKEVKLMLVCGMTWRDIQRELHCGTHTVCRGAELKHSFIWPGHELLRVYIQVPQGQSVDV